MESNSLLYISVLLNILQSLGYLFLHITSYFDIAVSVLDLLSVAHGSWHSVQLQCYCNRLLSWWWNCAWYMCENHEFSENWVPRGLSSLLGHKSLWDLLEFEVLMCVWLVNEDVCCLAQRSWLTASLPLQEPYLRWKMLPNTVCLCVYVCVHLRWNSRFLCC